MAELTGIDPWFLTPDRGDRRPGRDGCARSTWTALPDALLLRAKRDGFSDRQLAQLLGLQRGRGSRAAPRVEASCRSSSASTPAPPSSRPRRRTCTRPTRKRTSPSRPTDARSMILGGGPNRIGQGIEFDYCCCHASFALREEGIESIMVNCNPETVSTDYDTSDRLYFEPLTLEDVLQIVEVERPEGRDRAVRRADAARSGAGAAGQRRADPRHLARLDRSGRGPHRFGRLLRRPGNPGAGVGYGPVAARRRARSLDASAIPVLVRPSYVLGGRAMFITHDEIDAGRDHAPRRRGLPGAPGAARPVSRGRLRGRRRRAVPTASDVVIAGIMQHIEEAGIHSGDSACVIPPFHRAVVEQLDLMRDYTREAGPGAGRAGPDERAVRDQGRDASTCWRSTRGPAGPCPSWPRRPACRWPASRPR